LLLQLNLLIIIGILSIVIIILTDWSSLGFSRSRLPLPGALVASGAIGTILASARFPKIFAGQLARGRMAHRAFRRSRLLSDGSSLLSRHVSRATTGIET
jgi:hypothetical protein